MTKKKPWYSYLWLWSIVYFALGFFNILFAWLGLIDFLLPLYAEEGKRQLTVAIGCTGGKHRSVTIAEALATHLRDSGEIVSVIHRDISNGRQ